MASEDNYNENNVSPLTAALLTLLIGGLVWLGASFFDNLTDYGSQPKPDPVNLMASGSTEENFYSPGRAKRRANFFLRRQGEEAEISSEEKELLEEEDRSKERDKEDREDSRQGQRGTFGNDDLAKAIQPMAPSDAGWGENETNAISPVVPNDLKLSGIMLGSGSGIAVIEYNGTSYTKSEGQKVGRYTVAKILSDRVVVEDGVNNFTLGLNSSGTSDLVSSSAGTSGSTNGHPVLPDPGQVPPPEVPVVRAKTAFKNETSAAPSIVSSYANDEDSDNVSETSSAPVPSKIDVYDFAQERRAEEEKKANSMYAPRVNAKAKVKLPKASPTPVRPTREEIEKYLQRGAAIISEIKVQPDSSGLGVKVKFVQEDNVLHRLGIKDGDVITRVNNKTILNSEELFNSVLNISEMPFVNIEYKRQGQTGTLIYDL